MNPATNAEGARQAQHFDASSKDYDEKPFITYIAGIVAEWMISQDWWPPEGSMMEFGCGTGNLSLQLLQHFEGVAVGVDVSQGMLDKFQKKVNDTGLQHRVRMHAVELTGPGQLGEGAAFGLICTQLTLHHIRNCASITRTLASYLAPKGWLVVADLETTENAEAFHPGHAKKGDHYEHEGITEGDVKGWLAQAGLRCTAVDRLPFQKEVGEGERKHSETFQLLVVTGQKNDAAEQTALDSSAEEAAPGGGASDTCLACHKKPLEYECVPCGCRALCRGCAMKLATGGRCKRCKDMFSELRQARG